MKNLLKKEIPETSRYFEDKLSDLMELAKKKKSKFDPDKTGEDDVINHLDKLISILEDAHFMVL